VTFRHANLFDGSPLPQFDLILCRNVMLYFSSAHARRAETLLYNALAPDGWLLLGQAESIRHQRERWITHLIPGAPVYQKHIQAAAETQNHDLVPVMISVKSPPSTGRLRQRQRYKYDDAVLAIQHELYDDAEHLLSQLLTEQPAHAPAHLLLACVFANRHQLAEAHARLDAALRLDPLLADGHYLRAMLLLEEGKMAEVREALRAVLYSQRNHPLASFMLGNIYARSGQLPRAVHYWENARRAITSLKPDSPVSDISHITAGQLNALVGEQLNGWRE
jgi:chemotaxis protein methyltransferase CheR